MEALGLNTSEMLAAACERLKGMVNTDDIFQEDSAMEPQVARIRSKGVFHSDRAMSEGMDDTDEHDWVDIGIDNEE